MDAVAEDERDPSGPVGAGKALLRRPWILTILLASGVCVAYLVGVFAHWGAAADRALYANLGMIPIGFAATVLAANASRAQSDRRSQWAWGLLGAGFACFFAGDLLFFIFQTVVGDFSFPSLADAGYLAYYPLAFAGLLRLPSPAEKRPRPVILYVGCSLLVLGGATAIVLLLLLPTLQSSHDDLFAYALSVGYPLGDLLLLTGTAWVLLRRMRGHERSMLLLTGGLLAGLVADALYGYESIQHTFASGGFSDGAYMVSWALFAWAGYTEIARRIAREGSIQCRRRGNPDER
jgi:hypothetical protein